MRDGGWFEGCGIIERMRDEQTCVRPGAMDEGMKSVRYHRIEEVQLRDGGGL